MDGIWIRSQRGETLMFCLGVDLNYDNKCYIDGFANGTWRFTAGKYASAERAKEVMDDIQKHIYNGVHQVYQMPKE